MAEFINCTGVGRRFIQVVCPEATSVRKMGWDDFRELGLQRNSSHGLQIGNVEYVMLLIFVYQERTWTLLGVDQEVDEGMAAEAKGVTALMTEGYDE